MQELVEELHDDSSNGELEDNGGGVGVTELFDFSVHAGEEVGEGFSNGHDETEEFSSSLEALTVHLGAHVHVNEFGSTQKLHNHGGGDDG